MEESTYIHILKMEDSTFPGSPPPHSTICPTSCSPQPSHPLSPSPPVHPKRSKVAMKCVMGLSVTTLFVIIVLAVTDALGVLPFQLQLQSATVAAEEGSRRHWKKLTLEWCLMKAEDPLSPITLDSCIPESVYALQSGEDGGVVNETECPYGEDFQRWLYEPHSLCWTPSLSNSKFGLSGLRGRRERGGAGRGAKV